MAALTVAVSAVTWVILRCSRAAERSPASVAWLGGHHLLPRTSERRHRLDGAKASIGHKSRMRQTRPAGSLASGRVTRLGGRRRTG